MDAQTIASSNQSAQEIFSVNEDDGFVPRTEILRKLKPQIVKIGTNGTPEGFEFARLMFECYPELKEL
jgi:hypothetical protein